MARMPVDSPRDYFEALAARGREPRLHTLVGACEVDVEGVGSWTVYFDRGALRVNPAADPAPTVRMRFEKSEFVRLCRGEGHENLLTAALRGEILDFHGDLAFAQRLQAILPLPDDRNSPS